MELDCDCKNFDVTLRWSVIYMDYKKILVIVIVVVGKFLPNNPLSILGNYIKNLFIRKS